MARVGVCRPYFGKYGASGSSVSYTYVGRLAYAVSVDVSLDNSDPVILYADNGPRESASGFSGGTLTIGADELPLDIAGDILGLTVNDIPATQDEHAYKTMKYQDAIAPYVGVGFIIDIVYGGAKQYLAVVVKKVQFQVPQLTVNTQGESVEFQTPSLVATIMKDDQATPEWREDAIFDNLTQADKWVKEKLGHPQPSLSLAADIATGVDLLGKDVTDLQSGVSIGSNGVISGTLLYVDDYTGFSGDPAEQVGNFLAVKATAIDGATIVAELIGGTHGPVILDPDGILISRIRSTDEILKFTATYGEVSEVRSYALTGLTLNES